LQFVLDGIYFPTYFTCVSPGFRLAKNNSCESMKAPLKGETRVETWGCAPQGLGVTVDYKMSLSNIQGAIGLAFFLLDGDGKLTRNFFC